MANIDDIAKAFVNHYYSLFDSNREQLAGLYVSAPFWSHRLQQRSNNLFN